MARQNPGQSSASGSSTLSAKALVLGERIDTAGLERRDAISTTPLSFPEGSGLVVVFRYGVVVLIGLDAAAEAEALKRIRPKVNSDLPGEIIAQVTEGVYDHATGRTLLIPQGARLVGKYDSQVAFGQSRALIVWNRIIMPDGRSVDLGVMTGADLSGASGLADKVNSHIGPMMRAIALSTAITVGGAVAENASARSSGNLVLSDAAGGVSSQASQVGQRFVDRELNRQPTIEVRPGWPLTVLVSKDLVLEPY